MAITASATNAAAVTPGGNVTRAVGGGRQRGGAHAERERRQADQRRQQAPDHEQDADEVDVRGHRALHERGLDGDANFDADGAGLRRREPETERRAVGHAGRQ